MVKAHRLSKVALFAVLLGALAVPGARAELVVGVNADTGSLFRIDPFTGATTFLTNTGLPVGTFDASTSPVLDQIMVNTPSALFSVNVPTGATTPIGSFTGATTLINSIGFDVAAGVMYGTDYSRLFIVNPLTAATQLVGSFGVGEMWGMTFVPGMGLVGVSQTTRLLYRINTTTGAATAIGPTGTMRITDLAYDPASDRLVASANFPNIIYQVNRTTGQATLLNNVGVPNALGIAEVQAIPEPATLTLWGIATLGMLGYGWRRRSRVR